MEAFLMLHRRSFLAALAGTSFFSNLGLSQTPSFAFLTAGQGSAFLPYGEGLKKALAGVIALDVKETKGSVENLGRVDNDASALGMAFLGTAYQAVKGIAPFNGKPLYNVRALLPTYDTSFHIAVLAGSPIRTVADLAGKKVGIGPAGGPQQVFLTGLVEVAGINLEMVTGTTNDLGKALLDGGIDAFWQGASVPIPVFTQLTRDRELRVFGLSEAEVGAMLKRFPYLARGVAPAGSYVGQTGPLTSISAWNVVIANKDMPDAQAYALVKAVLDRTDLTTVIGPAAGATKAANASANTVLPYHAGALRYYQERGIAVFAG
jgi:TRAP transporter TAXI family solute receptor